MSEKVFKAQAVILGIINEISERGDCIIDNPDCFNDITEIIQDYEAKEQEIKENNRMGMRLADQNTKLNTKMNQLKAENERLEEKLEIAVECLGYIRKCMDLDSCYRCNVDNKGNAPADCHSVLAEYALLKINTKQALEVNK